jgi:DNA-binding transcriptional MerR regulator
VGTNFNDPSSFLGPYAPNAPGSLNAASGAPFRQHVSFGGSPVVEDSFQKTTQSLKQSAPSIQERIQRAFAGKDGQGISLNSVLTALGFVGVLGLGLFELKTGKIQSLGKKAFAKVTSKPVENLVEKPVALVLPHVPIRNGLDLHAAAREGQLTGLLAQSKLSPERLHQLLLEKGLHNQTVLHSVAEKGHLPDVLDALKAQALSDEQIKGLLKLEAGGPGVLNRAAAEGHFDQSLMGALNRCGLPDDEIGHLFTQGKRPILHDAAAGGHAEQTIKALESKGFPKEKITEFLKAPNEANGFCPIGTAAIEGHLNEAFLKTVEPFGFDKTAIEGLLKAEGKDQRELIQHIAEKGHLSQVATALKAKGFNPTEIHDLLMTTTATHGVPPYRTAALNGHWDTGLMDTLKEAGLDNNKILDLLGKEANDRTLTQLIADKGHLAETVKALEAQGFQQTEIRGLLEKSTKGVTPLQVSVSRGNWTPALQKYADKMEILPSMMGDFKAFGIQGESLQRLLLADGPDGAKIIHNIAEKGDFPKLLLEEIEAKGLDLSKENLFALVTAHNKENASLMHYAGHEGYLPEVLSALQKQGFTSKEISPLLLAKGKEGITSIHAAADSGKLPDLLDKLKEVGFGNADIQPLLLAQMKNDIAAVHIAAEAGSLPDLLGKLKALGFKNSDIKKILRVQAKDGWTPFHSAAKKDDLLPELLQSLKTNGLASKKEIRQMLTEQTTEGLSAVHMAAEDGKLPALLTELRKHGFVKRSDVAPLLKPTIEGGLTPMHAAAQADKLSDLLDVLRPYGFTKKEHLAPLLAAKTDEGFAVTNYITDNKAILKKLKDDYKFTKKDIETLEEIKGKTPFLSSLYPSKSSTAQSTSQTKSRVRAQMKKGLERFGKTVDSTTSMAALDLSWSDLLSPFS